MTKTSQRLMKTSRRPVTRLGVTGLFLLASCFNIYVQFPTSELQGAARDHAREVYGGMEAAPAPDAGGDSPEAEKKDAGRSGFLEGFSRLPVVHAAEGEGVDVRVDTPAIRKIKEEQTARLKKLKPHFEAGRVGIAQSGDLAIRSEDGLDLRSKKDLRETVEAENKSRTELYREIARANKIEAERVDEIRSIWAKAWIEEAPAGFWVEIDGKWQKKPPKTAQPK